MVTVVTVATVATVATVVTAGNGGNGGRPVEDGITKLGSFNSFENINQTESSDQTLIQVKMYPNPTTSTSTIKWDLNEEMTLTVVDVRGVIVHQLSISPEMRITTIDLQNNGVYFLRLEKDGQPKWNGKLVKI